jgi:hypothetical protein
MNNQEIYVSYNLCEENINYINIKIIKKENK